MMLKWINNNCAGKGEFENGQMFVNYLKENAYAFQWNL